MKAASPEPLSAPHPGRNTLTPVPAALVRFVGVSSSSLSPGLRRFHAVQLVMSQFSNSSSNQGRQRAPTVLSHIKRKSLGFRQV